MSKKNKKGKKEKSKKNKKSNDEQIRLSGGIALSKLKHVLMKKKNKKGKKIEGIFIPLNLNYLTKGKDGTGVYMDVNVVYVPKGDQYDQNGFISQSVNSKLWKEAEAKEQEKMKKTPILGSIKDWGSSYESDDNSGNAGDIDEEDDLPF